MAVSIAAGATFVARAFAGKPKHVAQMIVEGVQHRGYAFIDVLQPCVTFNRVNTYDWYRKRVYQLEEESYDPSDREAAWQKAHEWEERIPLGVLYRVEGLPTYEDQVQALADGSPVSRIADLAKNPRPEQYEPLKEGFL